MESATQDIRNAIDAMPSNANPYDSTDDTLAQAALLIALASISKHLDRIYERLAHIEHHLEESWR